MRIVIELPPGHECGQLRRQAFHPKPGDEFRQVEGMRTDIADAAGRTAARGVGTPGGLLLAGLLQRLGQLILCVFHLYHADRAEGALRQHRTRLPHHRIPEFSTQEAA